MKLQILRAAIILVAGAALALTSDTPSNARMEVRTTNPDSPTLRTNGKIAFTSDRDGNAEIYTINRDGTGIRRLTFEPGRDEYPAWSPDGTRIAYLSQTQSGQRVIKTMNSVGEDQRVVTPIVFDLSTRNFCGERFSLAWSPDGGKIAFQEFGNIVSVKVDGTNRQNITNTAIRESEPSWGLGGMIAYASTLSGGDEVNGLDIRTTDGRRYADYGYFTCSTSPDLSPDGTKLAYVHSNDFPPPGYIVIFSANPPYWEREFTHFVNVMNVRWSPDGDLLAFTSCQYPNPCHVEIVDEFGQGRRFLTQGTNPSWQPLVPASCPNLIDCDEFFVRQHYLDFLSREPDTNGFNDWVGVLNSCANIFTGPEADSACDRIHVSQAFFRSPEFQLKGLYTFLFYKAAFGRLPEYAEIIPAMQSVTGQTANEVYRKRADFASSFVQWPEFTQAYGGMTNAQYVDALLSRYNLQQITTEDPAHPEGAGQVTLTGRGLADALANNSLTRAQALRAVVQSSELEAAEYNGAFVAMQYYGYLRRVPEETGYQAWLRVISQNPNNVRLMVNGFVNSQEYRSRFGPP